MTVRDVSVSRHFNLDWLLHPAIPSDFFQCNWESRPLLVTRDNVDYFVNLPGLNAVDELITATCGGKARTRADMRIIRSDRGGSSFELGTQLHGNGTPDIQAIYRAYQEGYSVVINGVHHRSAAVANLSRNLEGDLHHQVGANLYLTPQGGQGFAPHVDTHAVFILQLHGVKHWRVGTPPKDLQPPGAKQGPVELIDYSDYTLNPGDVLYLPRGFPHDATTSNSSSLHLTVGIHAYCWVDFMIEALGVMADDDAKLRGALPPGFLDGSFGTERISEVFGSFADAIRNETLAERVKMRLGDKLFKEAKVVGSGHFRSLDSIPSLNAESVVFRTPSLFCRVRSTSSESRIEFATNFVAGPAHLESALDFIAKRHQFAVQEIPGVLNTQEKLDLVSRLVGEGLLQIDPANQGGS
ncbi:cupin domain-containing protein [Streptomyces sp. NPDC048258]|uniref:cupin domain-containing protein n=1 Tax=Streptomyces sp. NPDC048258 TaxID=3365527 RepID=UPI00371F2C95